MSTLAPLAPDRNARLRLERRARLLAFGGNAWHLVEFGIAVGAGIAAGSVALIGFGLDSLIEVASAFVVVWLFTGARRRSESAEHRAQQAIAISYALLVAYIAAASLADLALGMHPSTSRLGIALASVTVVAMPLLARAKRATGRLLGSVATVREAEQNQICAYLSVALLAGLLLNALAGWWWADPVAALAIGGIAAREGIETWRGEARDCC